MTVGHDLELLTVGRISVDLYSSEPGAGWTQIRQFTKSIGGSPTNVAVAAARLGRRAAVFTKVGADPFGDYVRSALIGFGVDPRFVGRHPTLRTPLAFAALDPPDDPKLLFYREPTAPDLTIEPADVDLAVVADVAVLWISGTAVSAEPSRGTTFAMLGTRERRPITVVDLDYRPMFWPSAEAAGATIGRLIDHATVVVGNRTECEVAVGSSDPAEIVRRLLDRGVEWAIVKLGADGVLSATADEQFVIPPRTVDVVCGLGAGDAFGGALAHGMLSGWSHAACLEFANAAGAIVASRLMCADAMPTAAEVEALLEQQRVRD